MAKKTLRRSDKTKTTVLLNRGTKSVALPHKLANALVKMGKATYADDAPLPQARPTPTPEPTPQVEPAIAEKPKRKYVKRDSAAKAAPKKATAKAPAKPMTLGSYNRRDMRAKDKK